MTKIYVRGKRDEIGIGVTLEVLVRKGTLTTGDDIKALMIDDDKMDVHSDLVEVDKVSFTDNPVYVLVGDHTKFMVGETYDV